LCPWYSRAGRIQYFFILIKVAAKYSRLSRDNLKYKSAYLVLLDGNQIEVHTCTTESIVAPISDVRFGTFPTSTGRISNYL